MNENIHQLIRSLMELEAKGCHSVFFEYGKGAFRVRIFKSEESLERIDYEKTVNINTSQGVEDLEKMTNHVQDMGLYVINTLFQCHRRKFVKGEKAGKWEMIKPPFVIGHNATQEMLIEGSGYYITDSDNNLMYFICYNEDNNSVK